MTHQFQKKIFKSVPISLEPKINRLSGPWCNITEKFHLF